MTRRAVLGVGSMAAAGLFVALGSRDTLAQTPKRIDIHAHLWTADYLDLVQSFGRTDTPTQRNRGATLDPADIEKRFAMMDAAGVDLQLAVTYIANAGLKNEDVAAIQGGTAARMLGLT